MVGRVFNCLFILLYREGRLTLLQIDFEKLYLLLFFFGIARDLSQKNGEAYEDSVRGLKRR